MLKRLFRRLRPFRGALLIIGAGLLLEMGFNGLLPLSLRFLIDRAMVQRDPRAIPTLLFVLGAGAILASVAGLIRDRTWARTQARFLEGLRQEMFEHLQKLSLDYFNRPGSSGTVLSHFSNDLASFENAASMAIPWGLLPGFECVFAAVLLFFLNWKLWLAAMILWPWVVLAPRMFAGRANDENEERHRADSALLAELQENLAVQPVIKAFSLERARIGTFGVRNRAWSETAARAGTINSLLERSTTSGILLIQVAVLGLGAWMSFNHQMTIGTLVSFQALLILLANNLLYVMQYMPSVVQARGGFARIENLLATELEVRDAPDALEAPPLAAAIEARDLSFSYAGSYSGSYSGAGLNLDGVSLRIPRGSSVAFVGGSGSGKSTMLNLLMRFYDPGSGAVLVDGCDLRTLDLKSWREQTGVVFQESLLFDDSLSDNIRMAKPGAAEEEIIAAARAAEIHEFIRSLPDGYETRAGARGGNLSGGQRQRIAIARAILRNPAVLVLDEATSALDPATEYAINATLARLGRGRTTIAVTHRLSTAASADTIFVFEGGRLAEYGRHDSLLAQGGAYSTLWKKQSGFQVTADGSHAEITPERLGQVPILSGLSRDDLARLVPLFRSEAYRPGETIILEGDASGSFYIVVRGTVDVVKGTRRIAVLQDGDFFGEISLLTGSARTATVLATALTTCIALDKVAFDGLVSRSPHIRERMTQTAHERLASQAGANKRGW
jgi:ATP-binding cassette subfamily B protein